MSYTPGETVLILAVGIPAGARFSIEPPSSGSLGSFSAGAHVSADFRYAVAFLIRQKPQRAPS